MHNLDLICFDLDVTLLKGDGLYHSIVETCRLIAEKYPQIEAQELLKVNGNVWPKVWQETKIPWQTGLISGKEQSLEAWHQSLQTYGFNDEEAVRFASQTQLELYQKTHELYPDVEPIFSFIGENGYPLGLMTNGASDTQREKLVTLGIEDRFDVIAISGEVGERKPNAKIFDFVQEQLNTRPEKTVMVGDNIGTDIIGAQQAGWISVWINRTGAEAPTENQPDFTITSLTDLMEILPSQ